MPLNISTINKKDVFFIIFFEIGFYVFISMYINNNLSNCKIVPSFLDKILYNVLLVFPMVLMPLLFVFDFNKVLNVNK